MTKEKVSLPWIGTGEQNADANVQVLIESG